MENLDKSVDINNSNNPPAQQPSRQPRQVMQRPRPAPQRPVAQRPLAPRSDLQLDKDDNQVDNEVQQKAATSVNNSRWSGIKSDPNGKVLYFVVDKPIPGLKRYMRECGLAVMNVFDSIEAARTVLLIQDRPTRIVVVDSGTGKFLTTTIRAELIDMIGVNDEDSKFTIFYTDSLLRSEISYALGKVAKTIDWFNYDSTVSMVATVLSYKEGYYFNINDTETDNGVDENLILATKGELCMSAIEAGLVKPIIDTSTIGQYVTDPSKESIRQFKIKI